MVTEIKEIGPFFPEQIPLDKRIIQFERGQTLRGGNRQ